MTNSSFRSWLSARSPYQLAPAILAVVVLAGAGGYYLASGGTAATHPAARSSGSPQHSQKAATSNLTAAPASGTRVCSQPVLRSPYRYSGPASSFQSGEFGLPTYGTHGSDYPHASRGVIIKPGNSTAAAAGGAYQQGHTIYYFEPGKHVVQATMYTGDDSVYLGGYSSGAGEAKIDGVNGGTTSGNGSSYLSSSALGKVNADQTWEYLTIENYGASQNNAVLGNENGGQFDSGNIYKYDTIGPNEYAYNGSNVPPAVGKDSGGGYAIGLSGDTTIEYDCLTRNAQGAFNGTGANDIISHNEISWNALGEYPDTGGDNPYACGCSGGGKLFFTVNAVVTDNYVHDNYNTGIWFDFDNTGADIAGNYIASNWGNGIEYEASYNARIADNTLVGNGWASDGSWPSGGRYYCYQHVSCTGGEGPVSGAGGDFPYAAMYLPNSGGNSNLGSLRLPDCSSNCTVRSKYSGELTVKGNAFINNFGEIMVYTDTNRYPDNIDGDSSCSIPLGALDQPNSKTYYLQTEVLETSSDATISGSTVHVPGGTKTICQNYDGSQTNSNTATLTRAPSAGMAVFNLNTGAMIGTVADATSASTFRLAGSVAGTSHAQLLLSAYGGCGPADYYHGGPTANSGKPVAAYWLNCIWGSRNISVTHNSFRMDSTQIKGCTQKNLCGYTGLLAFNAGVPALMKFFQSYPNVIARATGGLGIVWSDNRYSWQGSGGLGTWGFWAGAQGTQVTQAEWQAGPYGQDAGSSFTSAG